MVKLKHIDVPFTQVANEPLRDPELSWKAKGIYAYIRSKPDGWNFSANRMKEETKDGRDSTLAGILELENAGYLLRMKMPNGRVVYTPTHTKNPKTENPTQAIEPETENPTVGKSHCGKSRPISNKDIKVIKSISNTEAGNEENREIVSKEWNVMIDLFAPINALYTDFYKNTTERKALEHIAKRIGKEKLTSLLEMLPDIVSQPYAPKITKPTELKRDFGKLILFIKQNKNIINKYQPTKVH